MSREMSEAELRRRVGKLRDVPENSWAYLRRMSIVDEALGEGFDEQIVAYMVEEFDELRAGSPESTSRFRRDDHGDDADRNVLRGSLSASQREREAAVEEYLAMCAACDPQTRKFRKDVLEDRSLTEEEARALVQSPAARFFDETCFEYAGGEIPLVSHRAVLDWHTRESGEAWEVWYRAGVTVEPSGTIRIVAESDYEPPWIDTGRSKWRDRKYGGGGSELFFIDYKGRPRRRSVWRGSPLERLRRLSESLARRYRWEPAQSTMFVITGKPPKVPALKATTELRYSPQHLDATITVEASPWVSPKAVERLFRKAQVKVMGTRGGRPPGLKNLKLLRFCTQRTDPTDRTESQGSSTPPADLIVAPDNIEHPCRMKMPKGKALVKEWNQTYPEWAYRTSVGELDTRRFWRDYNRIKKTIAVGPPYQRVREGAVRQSRQTDGS